VFFQFPNVFNFWGNFDVFSSVFWPQKFKDFYFTTFYKVYLISRVLLMINDIIFLFDFIFTVFRKDQKLLKRKSVEKIEAF